jgi:hypothetical protein
MVGKEKQLAAISQQLMQLIIILRKEERNSQLTPNFR